MEVLNVNDIGQKSGGLKTQKKKEETHRAYTHSPNKRGVPSCLRGLSKALGSWKLKARAWDAQAIDAQDRGTTAEDSQATESHKRSTSPVDALHHNPNRKRGRFEITPNDLPSSISFPMVATEQHCHLQ